MCASGSRGDRAIAAALEQAGYAVDCGADGERADFLGQTETYDAIVLDLGLPKVDGVVCENSTDGYAASR